MFKLKRVKVMLTKEGGIIAIVGADIAGTKRLGRVVLVRPGDTLDFWHRAQWINVEQLQGKPHKGPANNEDDFRFMPADPAEREAGIGKRFRAELEKHERLDGRGRMTDFRRRARRGRRAMNS